MNPLDYSAPLGGWLALAGGLTLAWAAYHRYQQRQAWKRWQAARTRWVTGRTGGPVAQPLKWGGVIASRVIPMPCYKPDGTWEMGWQVKAHNDGERAEVLIAWINQKVRAA